MGDAVTKETLYVAGLLTNVYARSSRSNSSEPIVVLFFLPGRGNNTDGYVDSTARAAFAWVEKHASSSKRSPPPRDFIVVTFVRGHFQGWLLAARDESMMMMIFGFNDWSWPCYQRFPGMTLQDQRSQGQGQRTVDKHGNLEWTRKLEKKYNEQNLQVSAGLTLL